MTHIDAGQKHILNIGLQSCSQTYHAQFIAAEHCQKICRRLLGRFDKAQKHQTGLLHLTVNCEVLHQQKLLWWLCWELGSVQ